MTPTTASTLRDQRTYFVSDERLRVFAQLSHAQRLQWVEQCSQFVRMARLAKEKMDDSAPHEIQKRTISS
jgi:hypothetical protein